MGKLAALVLITSLAVTGGAAAPAHAPANTHGAMVDDIRANVTTLAGNDAELVAEAGTACALIALRGKDAYRESVMAAHADVAVALDHLVVAAAAKKHICA